MPTFAVSAFVVGATWLLLANAAQAQSLPMACGSLANAYGPYDYRSDRDKLSIVETRHFTTEVELLIKGSRGYLGGDLDYTLRAFPNHPKALLSMMRYGERLKLPQVPNAHYSVECYFLRAVAFKPDDTTARMLYATFLENQSRRAEALAQLAAAESYADDYGFTHYNLGLMYFDLGEFEKSQDQAKLALTLGFARPNLKNKLVAAGHWEDDASAAVVGPKAASTASP